MQENLPTKALFSGYIESTLKECNVKNKDLK